MHAPRQPTAGPAAQLQCSDCEASFPTPKQLALHRRMKHPQAADFSLRTKMRRLIEEGRMDACPACGLLFRTVPVTASPSARKARANKALAHVFHSGPRKLNGRASAAGVTHAACAQVLRELWERTPRPLAAPAEPLRGLSLAGARSYYIHLGVTPAGQSRLGRRALRRRIVALAKGAARAALGTLLTAPGRMRDQDIRAFFVPAAPPQAGVPGPG